MAAEAVEAGAPAPRKRATRKAQAPADAPVMVYRVPAAAAMLGVGVRTLEGWRRAGTGPAYVRMGKRSLGYTGEALRAFLEACQRSTTGGR